jgi:hypothetical protein
MFTANIFSTMYFDKFKHIRDKLRMLFFYQDLMIKNLKFKLILYISHMIFLPTKLCYGVFVILLKILTKFPSLKKARELGLYL